MTNLGATLLLDLGCGTVPKIGLQVVWFVVVMVVDFTIVLWTVSGAQVCTTRSPTSLAVGTDLKTFVNLTGKKVGHIQTSLVLAHKLSIHDLLASHSAARQLVRLMPPLYAYLSHVDHLQSAPSGMAHETAPHSPGTQSADRSNGYSAP